MARFTDLKVSELDNGCIVVTHVKADMKKGTQESSTIGLADWATFLSWLAKEVTPITTVTDTATVTPIRSINDTDNVF